MFVGKVLKGINHNGHNGHNEKARQCKVVGYDLLYKFIVVFVVSLW